VFPRCTKHLHVYLSVRLGETIGEKRLYWEWRSSMTFSRGIRRGNFGNEDVRKNEQVKRLAGVLKFVTLQKQRIS